MRYIAPCLAALVCAVLAPGQDFSQASIQQIAKGFTFAEGPAWSKDGYLVVSDTPADRLLQLLPGREPQILRDKAGGPSGNAFDSQGRLYTCETRARRLTRTDKNGRLTVLAERWDGKRLNAPNDLAISRNDHVYFTDPAFGQQSDHRELDFYGVYHVTPKDELKLVAKPVGRPNGIALSPNGRILYVTNTDERNVRAYDLDRNGEPSTERVFIAKLSAVPDGIKVDEKGDLFVVLATGVAIFGADGHLIRHFEMHERPSNCVFGDADGKSLYITARGSVFRLRLDAKGENEPGRQ
jgi:sugar lactone lactonase YvrE